MFVAALVTIAKIWKQSRYPSADRCIKKCETHTHTHTHTQEYSLALKKKEILSFAIT